MRHFLFLIGLCLSFVFFFSCKNPTTPVSYSASSQLDSLEQRAMLTKIIRYIGKLPENMDTTRRMDAAYEAHFQEQIPNHRLDLYHHSPQTNEVFLLTTRIAPSLSLKRVATGIRYRLAGDSIAHYEEVFRTWKMPEPELAIKSLFLFEKMVQGEDLSPYQTINSGNTDYIEFPDAETKFDTSARMWKSNRRDPLDGYYHHQQ